MYKALYKDRSTLWAMFLVNAGKNIQNSLKIPSICMGMDIRKEMEHNRIHKEKSKTHQKPSNKSSKYIKTHQKPSSNHQTTSKRIKNHQTNHQTNIKHHQTNHQQNIKNHQESPILRCLRQAALRRFAVNTADALRRSPLQAAREGTQLRGLREVS